ncbi:Vacuolar transporter chaperone 4 [Choanephora cucurbitarum]|uniref:Vacuolar transporter chaperone 4 n=1 Tax=Choanephora cucurbitarum TaxID=101091 RepID=A0A1C7N9Y9_9FUNG|nr:Vacuolar transporter chaperone 4 [Choanephora cucurbitarum]
MKYGQELQQNIFPPWRHSYVEYDLLKYELKNRQLNHGWTKKDDIHFTSLLEKELSKVYDFVNAKLAEIDSRILYCERTIQTLQKNNTVNAEANYSIMDEALTEILFDVNDLSRFTRVNYVAIQKILKKHDKWTQLNLKQEFVTRLREKPLDKQRFDVAIVYISALHDICRNQGRQSPGNSASGGDQNAFERATAKYWIHPDNITEVKAIIMLHLPVLIFDKRKKWEPSDSSVSSTYFDNPNFDLYTSRLQRDEGAEAIRFRWYGPMNTNTIFIERKTHHAQWLNGASVKDRFKVKENRVNSFVSSQCTPEQVAADQDQSQLDEKALESIRFTAQGVQKSFSEKQLEPILRIFYNRTAFQLPDNQRVRISLDTDLTFIREDNLDGLPRRQPSDNWRRNDIGIDHPFYLVRESDILKFPYAVLETKIQTHLGQETPAWLTSLVESHLVHEVPQFSKYLHGASHFYREKLPLLPWWLSELNVDIRKPRTENIGLTRSRSFKPLIDGQYRRAMIEKTERANQKIIVQGLNSVKTKETIPPVPPTKHTPSKKIHPTADSSLALSPISSPSVPTQRPKSSPSFSNSIRDVFHSNGKRKSIDLEIGKPVSEEKRLKSKIKSDPKVYFANERTFISWLQFCALLLTVALNLLNFGDIISRTVGGIFIGLSAGIAMYALYRFEKRAWMINRRIDGRYDDVWGPAVLCILLVIALIVNFYLRFR